MKITGHRTENNFFVIEVSYHGFFRKLFGLKPIVKEYIETDRMFLFGGNIVWLEYPNFKRHGKFPELDAYYLKVKHKKKQIL